MTNGTSVVVDTHAFIWYLRDDPDLSPTAGEILDAATAAGHPIVVPAVTLWGLALSPANARPPRSSRLDPIRSDPGAWSLCHAQELHHNYVYDA